MVFLHNPSTPQGLSPKLHSFWGGPYKITQVISEMTYKICDIETNKELIVNYDCMKPCRSPPGGFVPPANTPSAPMQPPNELASNSTPAKCHSCFCEPPITCTSTVDPVLVSSSVPIIQPALPTTFASSPVANDNPPEPSAPLEEETFPNRSSDSTLPYSSIVPDVVNSPNCSFNTAVSSTSFLDDPFPEQHAVFPHSRSILSINTSTPTKAFMQRPLQTDALLIHASSRLTTLSSIRRAEDNCHRLLRSNTANQRHATAQHILNKQLPHELKNELGLETTQRRKPRNLVVNLLKQRSPHHKPLCATVQSVGNSISAHSAKTRVPKLVASCRQTKYTHKNHVFHFIDINSNLYVYHLPVFSHRNQFPDTLVSSLFFYFLRLLPVPLPPRMFRSTVLGL